MPHRPGHRNNMRRRRRTRRYANGGSTMGTRPNDSYGRMPAQQRRVATPSVTRRTARGGWVIKSSQKPWNGPVHSRGSAHFTGTNTTAHSQEVIPAALVGKNKGVAGPR